jgi:hypothetical protein
MLAGVRLKFSDIYRDMERSPDPSLALKSFLAGLHASKKPH